LAQADGQAFEHLVAHQMPVAVVDGLEVVDVRQDHGQGLVAAAHQADGLLEERVQSLAVQKSRELVRGGHFLHAVLIAREGHAGDEHHQQGHGQAHGQIYVQRAADARQCAVLAFVHEQKPLEFRDIAHVQEVRLPAAHVLERAVPGI